MTSEKPVSHNANTAALVIIFWNQWPTLNRAVASALKQTRPFDEIVLVDNGSENGGSAADVLAGFHSASIRLIRNEENVGPSAARNLGASACESTYVAFLDGDDEFENDWLATMLEVAEAHSAAVVSCGTTRHDLASGTVGTISPHPQGAAFGGRVALFQTGTLLLRREAFMAIGGYDEDLRFSENTDLGLRLCRWADVTNVGFAASPLALHHWWWNGPGRHGWSQRLSAAERILDRHSEALSKDRRMWGDFEATAGVAALRLGNLARARAHVWKTVLIRRRPRDLARALAATTRWTAKRWLSAE